MLEGKCELQGTTYPGIYPPFRDLRYNQIEELTPGIFNNNPELTIL